MTNETTNPSPKKPSHHVRVREATNGQYHWRVTSANNKVIATGGETFIRRGYASASFIKLATSLRAMSEDEFEAFMHGLGAK